MAAELRRAAALDRRHHLQLVKALLDQSIAGFDPTPNATLLWATQDILLQREERESSNAANRKGLYSSMHAG